MTNSTTEVSASTVAELLLYHAALGRGYQSPFPPIRGLVFSSALPDEAAEILGTAEAKFRVWHEEQVKGDREALASAENQPSSTQDAPAIKARNKALKEKLARQPHVTWKEDQVVKSSLVELLKKSYYGGVTYFDKVGARLAGSMSSSPARLASDLSWVTLAEGSTDEALIRSNSTGGTLIHTLNGSNATFNYICSCRSEEQLRKLQERIQKTTSGQVGMGHCILLFGDREGFSGASSEVIYEMLSRVYVRGEKDESKRVKVEFTRETRGAWESFLNWELADIIGTTEPTGWQLKLCKQSPATVRLSVLMGARAAMVAAFMQRLHGAMTSPIELVELDASDLANAKKFARLMYLQSSGHDQYARKVDNLTTGKRCYITQEKLSVALRAMEEAIEAAEDGRIPRGVIRSIPGATLGLVDELVSRGDLKELSGVEECKMGRTTRAYVLPADAPGIDSDEAVDEFAEAEELFKEAPDMFAERDVIPVYLQLQKLADSFNNQHFMPAIPLSKMSATQRKMLPKMLDSFGDGLLLRGTDATPEPDNLLDDESPLDIGGLNLWVRYRPGTQADFYDWDQAGKLHLAKVWSPKRKTTPE